MEGSGSERSGVEWVPKIDPCKLSSCGFRLFSPPPIPSPSICGSTAESQTPPHTIAGASLTASLCAFGFIGTKSDAVFCALAEDQTSFVISINLLLVRVILICLLLGLTLPNWPGSSFSQLMLFS